ncbi:DUF6760 family protein [Streptomyces sp. NPDC050528]|uniref:DUF6760 family protein n=1 Tax=Streptomyces sp. NPDC050528 TaxID=3365623 RepID=UPI0037BD436F
MTYATDRLHEEVAYLGFHLGWGLGELLDLEHADRRRYVERTAALLNHEER